MPLNLSNLALNRLPNNSQVPSKIYMIEGDDFKTATTKSPYEIELYYSIEQAINEGLIDISAGTSTTNLTTSRTNSTVTVESSSGADGIIPNASQTLAGVMTAADKTKLDGLENGWSTQVVEVGNTLTGNGTPGSPLVVSNLVALVSDLAAFITNNNLTTNSTATTTTIIAANGTDAIIPSATSSLSGVMSNTDKIKLDDIKQYAWYNIALDNIIIYSSSNPTSWVTEVNPQEYTIVVPLTERLDKIAYLSETGVNRNSSTNTTIFNINTSARVSTNTTMLNTFTPVITMNTQTGNVVPVGIGGSPSVLISPPSAGIRTITIQGNTGIDEGLSRIQINNLIV